MRPMWTCAHCGRSFASRNQTHTCARLGELDRHFARSEPAVRETFDRVLAAVQSLGPVQVLAEKTRIALHARMSFAASRIWHEGQIVRASPMSIGELILGNGDFHLAMHLEQLHALLPETAGAGQ